jgi:hypothetical protein
MPIDLDDRSTWPKIGSAWEHRNGNIYRVVMFTNRANERQDKYPTTIVYRNISNQEDYSRRLDDWERSMTWVSDPPPGMFVIFGAIYHEPPHQK